MTEVATRCGAVAGTDADGITSFLGIPYAQPPVGELRFCPARPPAPFPGVRVATAFGPIAPQPGYGLGSYLPGDPTEQSEDCLTLNIWTPSVDEPVLPVIVFVHGGAFSTGSGAQVMYRGDHLARLGAVVVTFNYRLGVLGFLSHEVLRDSPPVGSGNWALTDQLMALAYVRDNIGAFGGDNDAVTLVGESAGAMCIADLLGSPRLSGLCRRVVLQSGSVVADAATTAREVAELFFAEAGLSSTSRRALLDLAVDDVLGAQDRVLERLGGLHSMAFRPSVDGVVLPRHPAAEIAAGSARGIDLLIGTNRDEFKIFSYVSGRRDEMTLGELALVVDGYLMGAGLLGPAADATELLACYEAARSARHEPASPADLLDAIATDVIFRVPALRLAATQCSYSKVFVYRFDWTSAFAGGALGACHGLELPFVFGTLDDPVIGMFAGLSTEALELSRSMQTSWIAFASCGDPNTAGTARWAPYDAHRRATMIFAPQIAVEDDPSGPERAYVSDLLGRYGVDDIAPRRIVSLGGVAATADRAATGT